MVEQVPTKRHKMEEVTRLCLLSKETTVVHFVVVVLLLEENAPLRLYALPLWNRFRPSRFHPFHHRQHLHRPMSPSRRSRNRRRLLDDAKSDVLHWPHPQ